MPVAHASVDLPSPASLPRLTLIGDAGVDLIMGPIAHWPQVGTETLVERCELRAGGSSGNAALAAGFLGRRARLISGLGDDDFGRWLREQFSEVEACWQICPGATTTTVGLLHEGGERSFFTSRGHLEKIAPAQVRAALQPAPPGGAVALLSGPFLTPALRSEYPQLIDELVRLGYEVALDTGWPPQGWDARVRAEVQGWIARCRHVLINEIEVTNLADRAGLDEAMDAVASLLAPGAALVVKTGAHGAAGLRDGQRYVQRTSGNGIFDTVGAGDAFNAAYLLAYLDGATWEDAIAAGCAGASAIIARFPRRGILPGEFAARLGAPQAASGAAP